MKYSTPELVLLGPASVLVQGTPPGEEDNGTDFENPPMGLVLGLD
jgi:hypothetical protein